MFVPEDASAVTKIVIVMHGASRDAYRYYRDWKTQAEKHGLIIVVPEYSKRRFEGSRRYNLGYTIYGHSAGSQFVHRFMYYKPGARVDRYFRSKRGLVHMAH